MLRISSSLLSQESNPLKLDKMKDAMDDLSKWDERTSSMKTKKTVQDVSQAGSTIYDSAALTC